MELRSEELKSAKSAIDKKTSGNFFNNVANPEYKIILYYRYTTILPEELPVLLAREKAVCKVLNLTGRIVLAEEGINGTLEGKLADIEKYKAHIKSDKKFKWMDIKESVGTGDAFPKLSVRVRDEIVTTGFDKKIDPRRETGKHLSPEELKKWYAEDKDFVVIDMRNDYEIKSGYFENTININSDLKASRDLPGKIKDLQKYKDKKVLTVCTGGVRCEKMSALLLSEGFSDVSQLDGGMHGYMQKYPGEHFNGTLFTFDNRLTMDFGGERKIVGECYFCKKATEEYWHCANLDCHKRMLVCKACNTGEVYCGEC